MLSTLEAEGHMSSKLLQEEIPGCWPVSNSSSAKEQLKKILTDEMNQSLEVVSV